VGVTAMENKKGSWQVMEPVKQHRHGRMDMQDEAESIYTFIIKKKKKKKNLRI
jgi:hypothetical protein